MIVGIHLSHEKKGSTLFSHNSVLWWWNWNDFSRTQAWVMVYRGSALHRPYAHPHLAIQTRSKGIQSSIFGAGLATVVARRLSVLITKDLWGSAPDFCMDLFLEFFPCLDMATRMQRFKIRIFFPKMDCFPELTSN